MGKPLKNLMLATIETIIEGVEREPWTAFINNTVAFTGVAFNYKQLIEEIKETKANPQKLVELEQAAQKKWGKEYDNTLVQKMFQLIWASVLYKVNTIIAIKELVEEFKHDKALKVNKL